LLQLAEHLSFMKDAYSASNCQPDFENRRNAMRVIEQEDD